MQDCSEITTHHVTLQDQTQVCVRIQQGKNHPIVFVLESKSQWGDTRLQQVNEEAVCEAHSNQQRRCMHLTEQNIPPERQTDPSLVMHAKQESGQA